MGYKVNKYISGRKIFKKETKGGRGKRRPGKGRGREKGGKGKEEGEGGREKPLLYWDN